MRGWAFVPQPPSAPLSEGVACNLQSLFTSVAVWAVRSRGEHRPSPGDGRRPPAPPRPRPARRPSITAKQRGQCGLMDAGRDAVGSICRGRGLVHQPASTGPSAGRREPGRRPGSPPHSLTPPRAHISQPQPKPCSALLTRRYGGCNVTKASLA